MESSQSSELTDFEGENDTKEKEDIPSLCPFRLLWSFGLNSEVPMIDLTTENRTIIAYACSHAIIIYNYVSKTAISLQGHVSNFSAVVFTVSEHPVLQKSAVRSLSITKDGKWLLSADFEKDPVVVVWDTETGVPICTLFNPHEENQITAARISPNAKYIVTVGNEKHQKVCFWLWTYGRDEPDGFVELPEIARDRVKDICFNEEFPEEFALTADKNVIFFNWKDDKLEHHYPEFPSKLRYGIFNCSCYVRIVNLTLTATTHGYVLVWNMTNGKEQIKHSIKRRKHMKSIRLQKCNITVILYHDGMVITGNCEGRINFYDLQLRILYWCQNCGLDPIRSISFHLQSKLWGPPSTTSTVDGTHVESDEEYDLECEAVDKYFEPDTSEETVCSENIEYVNKLKTKTLQDSYKVPSEISINLEHMFQKLENQKLFLKPPASAVDATRKNNRFYVDNFFVCTSTGSVAIIKISILKCQFILHGVEGAITSLDAHPRSDFIVTGNGRGVISLYNYEIRKLIVRRKTPNNPDIGPILDNEARNGRIVYFTCPRAYEKLSAITALKYAPIGDILACGTENGVLWMLHPITLQPLDEIPYRHSNEFIMKLTFSECAEYMAYTDNTFVVAVFKRNHDSSKGSFLWDFLGKYRSHYGPVRDIIFEPATPNKDTRFFSLGEDQNLIEYDLNNSGPYPDPGLVISQICKIEYSATPLCFACYPIESLEKFLIVSNSEYKYRLLNDETKLIRGTFLGPIFDTPVTYLQLLTNTEMKSSEYIIFATDKEVGLQIIPFDGNPYKILGIVGHPQKITNICVNHSGSILFTSGYNDSCVLMWKIKYRSVDVLARLGGEGLMPYYCLIEGGQNGWLMKEMIDLFYYAQILHQGENTTATRIVTDEVSIKQIPNLMRAIGFYPSNAEIEIFMNEISFRNFEITGEMVEEISFKDFVKLYINHRPVYEISMQKLQEVFKTFKNPNQKSFINDENSALTRNHFLNILYGKALENHTEENDITFGEPLTFHEAYMYLTFLAGSEDNLNEIYYRIGQKQSIPRNFKFLPERISYKDFTADIMGIELPEETRADDE